MKTKIPLLVLLGLTMPIAFAQTQDSPDPARTANEPAVTPVVPESALPEPSTSGAIEMTGTEQSSSNEASADAMASFPPAGPVQTLAAKTENGITYLCGGVGKDEAAAMKKAASDHDLMLTFATRRGDYLADVNVTIENARGEPVLRTTCDAPIMLVDMPSSGTYRIHAEAGGYRQDRTARINTKSRSVASLIMTWPQTLADAGATTPGVTSTGASGTQGSGSSRPERGERHKYQEGLEPGETQIEPDMPMPHK